MSDLFGNHIVGFPTRWLICKSKRKITIPVETFHYQCGGRTSCEHAPCSEGLAASHCIDGYRQIMLLLM